MSPFLFSASMSRWWRWRIMTWLMMGGVWISFVQAHSLVVWSWTAYNAVSVYNRGQRPHLLPLCVCRRVNSSPPSSEFPVASPLALPFQTGLSPLSAGRTDSIRNYSANDHTSGQGPRLAPGVYLRTASSARQNMFVRLKYKDQNTHKMTLLPLLMVRQVWCRWSSSKTIWTWRRKCGRWPGSWLLRGSKDEATLM